MSAQEELAQRQLAAIKEQEALDQRRREFAATAQVRIMKAGVFEGLRLVQESRELGFGRGPAATLDTPNDPFGFAIGIWWVRCLFAVCLPFIYIPLVAGAWLWKNRSLRNPAAPAANPPTARAMVASSPVAPSAVPTIAATRRPVNRLIVFGGGAFLGLWALVVVYALFAEGKSEKSEPSKAPVVSTVRTTTTNVSTTARPAPTPPTAVGHGEPRVAGSSSETEHVPALPTEIPPIYTGPLVNEPDRSDVAEAQANQTEFREVLVKQFADMREWEEVKHNADCRRCLTELEQAGLDPQSREFDPCLLHIRAETMRYGRWAAGGRPQFVQGRGLVEFSGSQVSTFEAHVTVLDDLMAQRKQVKSEANAVEKGPVDAKPREFVNRAYVAFATSLNKHLGLILDPSYNLANRVEVASDIQRLLNLDVFFRALLDGEHGGVAPDPVFQVMFKEDPSLRSDLADSREAMGGRSRYAYQLQTSDPRRVRVTRTDAQVTDLNIGLVKTLRDEAATRADFTPTLEALRPVIATLTAELQKKQAVQAEQEARQAREGRERAVRERAEAEEQGFKHVRLGVMNSFGFVPSTSEPGGTEKIEDFLGSRNLMFAIDGDGDLLLRWSVIPGQHGQETPIHLYLVDQKGNILHEITTVFKNALNQPASMSVPANVAPYVTTVALSIGQ